jgi:hypothetical protein
LLPVARDTSTPKDTHLSVDGGSREGASVLQSPKRIDWKVANVGGMRHDCIFDTY